MADENTGAGGGGAAPSAPASAPAAPAAAPAAAAPASAPSSTPSAAPSGPAAAAPQGGAPGTPSSPQGPGASSPAAGGAPAAPAARVIDSLPPRGSNAYWEAFDALPADKRYQAEQEWGAVENGQAEAPKPQDPNAPAAPDKKDPAAAPLPGDKPGEGAVADLFLDETELATLPEKPQQVIRAMQEALNEFAPMMDPKFQAGLEVFTTDPLIKNRIEEITAGNPWQPGDLSKDFDPSAYVKADEVEKLDPVGDPDGFKAYHDKVAKQAYEDGLKKGQFAKEYEMRQQIEFEKTKAKFDLGFNKLADLHPELKSKDPKVKEVTDPAHPMNPFVKWAAANYRDDFFLKNENAFEAAYAGFLASGGKLNEAITAHVQRERYNFIRNVNEAAKTAATAGRSTSSQAPQKPQLVPGVDTDRYIQDASYARQVFDQADWATKQKLEQLRNGQLKPA